MTVGELREFFKDEPDDAPVFISMYAGSPGHYFRARAVKLMPMFHCGDAYKLFSSSRVADRNRPLGSTKEPERVYSIVIKDLM